MSTRIKSNNIWGASGGRDVQRSDLWMLDLKIPVQELLRKNSTDYDLDDYQVFPQSVSLPEVRMKTEEIKKDNFPIAQPGYDEVIGATSVNFLIDTDKDKMSDILTFLDNWYQAGRQGRDPDVQLGVNFQPAKFKFDIYAWLFSGKIASDMLKDENLYKAYLGPTLPGTVVSMSASNNSANEKYFEAVQRYTLKEAWISSLKIGELSYGTSGSLLVTAQIQARRIILEKGT